MQIMFNGGVRYHGFVLCLISVDNILTDHSHRASVGNQLPQSQVIPVAFLDIYPHSFSSIAVTIIPWSIICYPNQNTMTSKYNIFQTKGRDTHQLFLSVLQWEWLWALSCLDSNKTLFCKRNQKCKMGTTLSWTSFVHLKHVQKPVLSKMKNEQAEIELLTDSKILIQWPDPAQQLLNRSFYPGNFSRVV